ncbi:MAG: molybdopterin synthase catalytic subunit MoaE [Gammaproteobacteria bacterium]|nr:MAG: molybdopterin synthase catalytic subunit MoaE [Gammaproteobacteria bacterium]RTZ61161.1 MAG: molybdopterin synthase catalytic subunit MoaE [Gammaproteobacteria bacterium]
MSISVQTSDFNVNDVLDQLAAGRRDVGALAVFVGKVRDINSGDEVSTLTLEHYPGMTEKSIAKIVAEAARRWALIDTTVIHRVGELQPMDNIVLVAVASAHRGDAFDACEFIMDYLKTRAPFWKKEQTPEGERWVEARNSDKKAAQRW